MQKNHSNYIIATMIKESSLNAKSVDHEKENSAL